jgi:hypothetical protein
MEYQFIAFILPLLGLLAWKLRGRFSTVSGANLAVPGAAVSDAPVAGTPTDNVAASAAAPASGFTDLIGELTSGFDLTVDTQRKSAYIKCYEYAREKLMQSEECNVFLADAAQILEQPPISLKIIDKMAEPSGAERINLMYSRTYGILLSANRPGLSYLARVMEFLSKTPVESEYVYFRGDTPPMEGDTYGLTVYYEPEEWFDRYTKGYDEKDEPYISERKISAAAVVALCVTVEPPLKIYLSKGKIFRVIKFEEYDGKEGTPTKRIRESFNRMYVFTLVDDRGQEIEIALDLDDLNVVFFTMGDLEQIIQ